jgi:hypothetical protein
MEADHWIRPRTNRGSAQEPLAFGAAEKGVGLDGSSGHDDEYPIGSSERFSFGIIDMVH